MEDKRKKLGIRALIVVVICLVPVVYIGRGYYHGAKTIHQLLTDNKQLKQSITNLTYEEQIGYAKVISQETINNKFLTTIKFVETARDDKLKKILEKEYTIEGDIIHFDHDFFHEMTSRSSLKSSMSSIFQRSSSTRRVSVPTYMF